MLVSTVKDTVALSVKSWIYYSLLLGYFQGDLTTEEVRADKFLGSAVRRLLV